jgi:DNA-3-methyladenine glycosylase II
LDCYCGSEIVRNNLDKCSYYFYTVTRASYYECSPLCGAQYSDRKESITMSVQIPFANVIAAATEYLSEVDPVMRATIELVGPCTLQPDPDVFSALVDAIISQQISVKAADAIMARVRAALPEGKVTPENLASLDFERLRALGLSTPKARYVLNLVEHIQSGQLQLERLQEMEDEEVINQLTAVKGIGRWTAEMCLFIWT